MTARRNSILTRSFAFLFLQRAALSAEFAQGVGSSEMELEELRLRESMLLDTTSFIQPRTLDTLADFVRKCMPSIAKSVRDSKDPAVAQLGRPALIMLTGNAQRAADLARSLRALGPELSARHFKLKEHEAWLREHTTPLAAGTPQRVAALIASGSLKLDSLQALVIDQTWVDAKQRNVFDSFETRDELMKLLALDAVMSAFKRSASPTKLVLF